VRIYDLVRHRTRTFRSVTGKPAEICALSEQSIEVALQGGRLELRTVRIDGGAKMSGGALAASIGLLVGESLPS
jgi:methionyl-tRNA formyltransferase